MALSNKQQAFINAYLKSWNATQAAIEAGYSEHSARSIGSENLTKPDVLAEIQRRIDENAMSANEVLARLAEHGRGDMADFWDIPELGDPVLNLASDRAKSQLRLIKRMKVKKTTRTIADIDVESTEVEFELYDAQAALEKLGRHHKLFTDKSEFSGPNGEPLALVLDR